MAIPEPSEEPLLDAARRYVPRGVRRATRGFALVLVLLAALYVLSEAWSRLRWTPPFTWALAFIAVIVTLRAVDARPRSVYQNGVVMAAALLLGIAGIGLEQPLLRAPADVLAAVYGFAAPIIITIHVLRRQRITTDVVMGALCVYFFLGIDFAILYQIIDEIDGAAFAGEIDSLFYFSFLTLTTVGFGDVTPVSDVARAVTVIEAVLGQVVLVAMVARLVGLQIAQSGARHDPET